MNREAHTAGYVVVPDEVTAGTHQGRGDGPLTWMDPSRLIEHSWNSYNSSALSWLPPTRRYTLCELNVGVDARRAQANINEAKRRLDEVERRHAYPVTVAPPADTHLAETYGQAETPDGGVLPDRALTERACSCSRHDVRAAQWQAGAESAGFGMRTPDWVRDCTEPNRPTNPDVIAFWRRHAEAER